MKEPRRRLEVNLEELDRVLDGARQAPLSEQDHHKRIPSRKAMVDGQREAGVIYFAFAAA